MRIEYRTLEGKLITYYINLEERGIACNDIDCLACKYFEQTNRIPDCIYLRRDLFRQLMFDLSACTRSYNSSPLSGLGSTITMLHLTIGTFSIKSISNMYMPVLVGNQFEFEDNEVNQLFEDIVLKDCEHI